MLVDVEVVRVTEVVAELVDLAVACHRAVELVADELVGVEQVELAGELACLPVGVEFHLQLACLCRFRGDDDYTVTTLRTIDGSQGGVLQDVDGLDVCRGNIVDVVGDETVDHEERLAVVTTQ